MSITNASLPPAPKLRPNRPVDEAILQKLAYEAQGMPSRTSRTEVANIDRSIDDVVECLELAPGFRRPIANADRDALCPSSSDRFEGERELPPPPPH